SPGKYWIKTSVLLAQRSSLQDCERARLRFLNLMEPQMWAHIFHHHNMYLLAQSPDFMSFCETFLSEHPKRELFEDAIVLVRIFAFIEDCDEQHQQVLEGIDVRRLLSNCEALSLHSTLLFPYNAIWLLGAFCNEFSAECGELFVEHAPF
ncbi:hypothetical protein BVRB_032770, partial [Beta vulgaris subsp. vulgaris]